MLTYLVLGANPLGATEHRQGIAMMLTFRNRPCTTRHRASPSTGNDSDWLPPLTRANANRTWLVLQEVLSDSPDLGEPCALLKIRKENDD